MYAFDMQATPENRADLFALSVLYVCVLWRGEAGHLELEVCPIFLTPAQKIAVGFLLCPTRFLS